MSAVAHQVTKSEVGNLDLHVFVEQEVFRLEVSVRNAVVVAVLYASDDLLQKSALA